MRESVKKNKENLFKDFYISLGTMTSCICLLKSQKPESSLMSYLMTWVYLNLSRLRFSVPYVLCIGKEYDKKLKEPLPTLIS